MKHALFFYIFFMLLAACGNSTPEVVTTTPVPATETATIPMETPVWEDASPTPTPQPRLQPEDWQQWPVVPETVSDRVLEIHARGQELGNNPQAYSKIGDCDASPTWFLGAFDGKPGDYSLGEYGYLQTAIDYFHGSHGRISLAAGNGFASANVLASFMADRNFCEANETPLACEMRIHRPAFALVSLGSNDIYHQDSFITNMRQILDILIEGGVVPILASKADNLEGDQAINLEIARLADEYELPFWNFWLAVQPLPAHGLQEDGAHLTWAGPYFDDPGRMLAAWPWRNLTAMQSLDLVWRWVTTAP